MHNADVREEFNKTVFYGSFKRRFKGETRSFVDVCAINRCLFWIILYHLITAGIRRIILCWFLVRIMDLSKPAPAYLGAAEADRTRTCSRWSLCQ